MDTVAKGIIQATGTLYAIGFKSFWQPSVCAFFPKHRVFFIGAANEAPANAVLLHWGAGEPKGLQESQTLVRLEDGFIRSVGLGAEFALPLSWVVDHSGMYFDATKPSDLELLLNQFEPTEQQIAETKLLIDRLTEAQITKYNVGHATAWQPSNNGKPIHLVVGQVETDASIALGATGNVRSNIALLKRVKQQFPDAYIVYKPHPDVVAKARAAGLNEYDAFELADEVCVHYNIAQLYQQINALHCITSLSGFEALLRNIPVYCYGMPFYAGWGLTHDMANTLQHRRMKPLTLEALVYASVVLYPLYTQQQNVQETLDTLQKQLEKKNELAVRWQRKGKKVVRKLLNIIRGGAR